MSRNTQEELDYMLEESKREEKEMLSGTFERYLEKRDSKKKVPVVSVEELKEICQGLYSKSIDVHPTAQDLLSAVRLQAKEKAVCKEDG